MSGNVKEVQGRTRILGEACTFTWSVENFSLGSLKDNEYLTSPSFTTGKSSYPKWCLQLYPNRKNGTETELTIGIFLRLIGAESSSHFVIAEISIIDSDKAKYYSYSLTNNFDAIHPSFGWYGFIDRNVVLEEERSSLLPNDTLTIMCEMKVTVGDTTSQGTEELINNDYPSSLSKNTDSLIGSLQHLHESKMGSDLTIKVGDEELQAHKLILCARSSVFSSMLNSDMKENLTNCIEISDFDSDVVKAMLRYIYCEQLEDLTPELSIQLYSIADKYNLQDLKNICVKFLLSNLNVHNICAVLVLGEMHNERELMAAAKKMFCTNAAAIQETEKWLDLSKTMPDLAIAMYRLAISQKET